MKKRTLSVLLTAAMAVSMLAGCGSKTEAPAETAGAGYPESNRCLHSRNRHQGRRTVQGTYRYS